MSFELSFSEDFFTGDAESYGSDPLPGRPRSILEAIETMSLNERRELVDELADAWEPASGRLLRVQTGIDVHGDHRDDIWIQCESFPWDILAIAREVDTCDQLSSPVTVYLDSGGWVGLDVYDSREDGVAS